MSRRRVVVTGLGLVTPVGIGMEETWSALVAGKSGIGPITLFDASTLPDPHRRRGEGLRSREVHGPQGGPAQRPVHPVRAGRGRHGRGTTPASTSRRRTRSAIGAIVGSGLGGLATIEDTHQTFLERGVRKISPFFVPSLIVNLAPGQITLRYGMKGPSFSPVSACATGNHSIGEAMLYIERGTADVMVAGGAEATITPLGIGGLLRRPGALRAERRAGEGQPAVRQGPRRLRGRRGRGHPGPGGVRARAQARGAASTRSSRGYGATSDAYHITSPAPEGEGGQRAMRMALADAGLAPEAVGYVNAHGTSTPAGDVAECQAITQGLRRARQRRADGLLDQVDDRPPAGRRRAAPRRWSPPSRWRAGSLHPTINVEEQDPECALDVIPNQAREVRVDAALSNSFGFGGTNAVLLFKRV